MFTKTVEFDAYVIGDRIMEGVIFDVDITLYADGSTTYTEARPHDEDVESWCKQLGGEGAVKHWCDQVTEHFSEEATRVEELCEAMTEEEYKKYEDILA